nr:hypothetical protein [Tanacetum cinerariifolium]
MWIFFTRPFVAPPTGDLNLFGKSSFKQSRPFFYAANLKVPTKKPKPHVIPYCQFTKLISCYLGDRHNIYRRPQSPIHITVDDYPLDNLKFTSKGRVDETTLTDEEGGKKKQAPPAGKSKQPTPAKQSRPVKEKTSKPTPSKKICKGKVVKVCKGKYEADTKILNVGEEQGEDVFNTVALEEITVEFDKGISRMLLPSVINSLTTNQRKKNLEKIMWKLKLNPMVTVPIHQASSSVPLLSTPIIDLTPPKSVSPPIQESIFIATTATITTLPPPPTPLPQSTTDSNLANCVTALKRRNADFEQKYQLQDKTTKVLTSRVYKLEHHDLY